MVSTIKSRSLQAFIKSAERASSPLSSKQSAWNDFPCLLTTQTIQCNALIGGCLEWEGNPKGWWLVESTKRRAQVNPRTDLTLKNVKSVWNHDPTGGFVVSVGFQGVAVPFAMVHSGHFVWSCGVFFGNPLMIPVSANFCKLWWSMWPCFWCKKAADEADDGLTWLIFGVGFDDEEQLDFLVGATILNGTKSRSLQSITALRQCWLCWWSTISRCSKALWLAFWKLECNFNAPVERVLTSASGTQWLGTDACKLDYELNTMHTWPMPFAGMVASSPCSNEARFFFFKHTNMLLSQKQWELAPPSTHAWDNANLCGQPQRRFISLILRDDIHMDLS